MTTLSTPNRFFAYVAVFMGGLLALTGVAAAVGYLGLPGFSSSNDILSQQLGQIAALFLGLICGPLAIYHGLRSLSGRPSSPLKLPPFYFFWIVFAVMLGLGNGLLGFHVAQNYLFPPIFLLGAALPTLAVVAWVGRRLGWPVTWRQAALALVAGSSLSVFVALVAEIGLSFVIYLLTAPLWLFGDLSNAGPNVLARLFFSPALLLFLFITALQAPIPEEIAKALSLPMFGRQRLTTERQALMIGLISGAAFAILENMLYEGVYAQYNGWSWGGITLLRGIGAVLHPVCSALVALGWFQMRAGGPGKLLKAYATAVGLHVLWNGGFQVLLYLTGLDYYSNQGLSVNLYGTAAEVLLIAYLAGLAVGLWWLLGRLVNNLSRDIETEPPFSVSAHIPARRVASWALASVFVIVPIGAAINGTWKEVVRAVEAGPVDTPTPVSPTPAPTSTPRPTLMAPTVTPTPIRPVSTFTQAAAHHLKGTEATGFSATPPWSILLSDEFDYDIHDWPTGDTNNQFANINREIVDSVYRWRIQAHGSVLWYSLPNLKGLYGSQLTVDARQVSGPEDATYGLVFRRSDNENYYYFNISDSGRYSFRVLDHNQWTTLISPTISTAIRPGGVNRLTVRAFGVHLAFYINDVLVQELDDASLNNGKAGVAVELQTAGDEAVFEFDNYEIRTP